MRRVVQPELLDSDLGTPGEIASSLGDLQRINRFFGGASTLRSLVRRVSRLAKLREMTALDVASASGDVPAAVSSSLLKSGIKVSFTLLDRAPGHLPPDLPAMVGDALHMPVPDASFDLVTCSLFLHHLEPVEIRRFIDEALRVARRALLINDLRRNAISLALVYAGLPLFRSRLTRHDSIVSVRRAYTLEEVVAMLKQTSASRFEVRRHYLYRFGAIVWK